MKRTLLISVSFVGIFLLSAVVVVFTVGLYPTLTQQSEWITTGVGSFLSYCMSLLVPIGLLVALRKPLQLVIPTLKPQVGRIHLPLVLLGFLLTTAGAVALEPILTLMPSEWMDPVETMMKGGVWSMMTAVIAAPILEEYLLRGILLQSLERSSGKVWTGIILSAVLFGLIHGIPQQVLTATVAGLILGAIYAVTRSLPTVVLVHMLNNGAAYLAFLFLGSQVELKTLLDSPQTYITVVVVAWVVLVGCAVWGVRKIGKK